MDLTPEYIEANLEKFGQNEARDILKQWIVNSNDEDLRIRALNLFLLIDDQKQFKFLEQLFLSDENYHIRVISGNILRSKYFESKKFTSLLEFTLNHFNDINQKIFAVELLNLRDTKYSRKIIKEYLKRNVKTIGKSRFNDTSNDIFSFDIDKSISPKVIEISINLILYLFYINSCGFSATLREGIITLLNCEGSNLKSIAEIKGIDRLFKLEHLYLQRNLIQEISNLNHLVELKTLNLSQNRITRIYNLEGLIKLKELNLSMNSIKKIENIDHNHLEKLILDKNLVTEIECLDNLVSLEHLSISYNNVSELKNLDRLIRLKSLHVSFNKINKISGLENLKCLTTLYLNGNHISSIRGINHLGNLRVLNLSNNVINKIENLENLENLIKLELSNNNIESLSGLDTLQNLQELFVDKNHIKNMKGIENLKNLIILFLEHNYIEEFNMSFIENLTNLNFIFLNENPLNPESRELYQRKTRYP
ncbi:MAG: leucine-rich repeat domain-containing protein [Candidatus Lokiarchaeota archaeon]|nr:leucine-rich repeat domain-containing protein [Candidatus Lokiarchaeota archaeon]